MSDLKTPGEAKKPAISITRILIWVIGGGIGLYLVLTGLMGIITKGS